MPARTHASENVTARAVTARASSGHPNDEAIIAVLSASTQLRDLVTDAQYAARTSAWIVDAAKQSERTWRFLTTGSARQHVEFSWFAHEAAATDSVCTYLVSRKIRNPRTFALVFERAVECIEAAAPRATLLADAVLAADREPGAPAESWLTPKEAADALGFKSPNTIKNWIRNGYFTRVIESPGGHRKVSSSDVDKLGVAMAAADTWRRARKLAVVDTDKDIDELL